MAAFLQKEIVFSANAINENLIEELVESVCNHYHIYNSYFGNIMIGVMEATRCNQLIQKNQGSKIFLRFESVRKGLQFTIFHPDGGFNIDNSEINESLVDKTENEFYKSLYLIHALSDDIIVSEDRTSLSLIFGTASINKDLSVKRRSALQSFMKSGIKEKVEK